MKIFILILSISLIQITAFTQSTLEKTLSILDKELNNDKVYTNAKLKSIAAKKAQISGTKNPVKLYELNEELIAEYESFVADSAINYALKNLEIAKQLKENDLESKAKLRLSFLYTTTGLYLEAQDILSQVDKKYISATLKPKYFEAYKNLFAKYDARHTQGFKYQNISGAYRDSLLSVLDKNSNHYQTVLAEKLVLDKNTEDARGVLLAVLKKIPENTHDYAVVTSAIGNIYKLEGNTELEKEFFAKSAIADIKNSIKENTSLQALSIALYESGDVERAYRYSKQSMEDAIFCNAPLRVLEISRLYPIIDSAYQARITKQKRQLVFYLILISALLAGLVAAILYALKQLRKVKRNKEQLHDANIRLHQLNKDLSALNKEMHSTNLKLAEANRIKEEYIGNFLNLCSSYIDKLEDYQKVLAAKAMHGKKEELIRILKSDDLIEKELQELYKNFDRTFLHLYPNFIKDFNKLLVETEQLQPKQGAILNAELRIFALIRLGITDSIRIANFLRYSPSTIYNYRTKVRNKAAVPRENFEAMVMEIGTLS